MGERLLIKIGNGATPEVFEHPTLINTSRSVSISTTTETDQLVDLADMSAPATTVRRVTSTDFKIDGEGLINKGDVLDWMEWIKSGEHRNLQITDGDWMVEGPFLLTAFQITGERAKSSTCQITLEQADEVVVAEV
ncbi:hypothetical protein GR702_11595 [Novosphingobium sp. FGD1]|uniref:Phage tail protein n=1 Tax=Novosphingobium silvae TaxID=2692619 RepID=A0A7X4K7V7_9SPHN|nr:hypothetical protein [Novosphingobium silvae]